jgi:hypothetical protein
VNRFLVKWSTRTKADITPGRTPDGMNFRPGLDLRLHVFAKGTATRVVKRVRTTYTDEEGNSHTRVEYVNHDQEFVDWIEYKVTPKYDETVVLALWRCDGMGRDSSWDNPLFSAETDAGFFSDGPLTCQTKEGWDPLLGLLLAHLCSTEYSPDALKNDFVPYFPHRNAYRGGGRPNGIFFDPYVRARRIGRPCGARERGFVRL